MEPSPIVVKSFRSPAVIDWALQISPKEMSEDRATVLAWEFLRKEDASYRLLRNIYFAGEIPADSLEGESANAAYTRAVR
jgi:hypothetical protein